MISYFWQNTPWPKDVTSETLDVLMIVVIMIADNKVSKCSQITKMTLEAIAKFSNTCSYHILVFSVINCWTDI